MPLWSDVLKDAKKSPAFTNAMRVAEMERSNGLEVYPPKDKVFNAFRLTPLDSIRCVIIGQDPYHEPGQAEGLAFSVADGVQFPPSLKNILTEIKNEYPEFVMPESGSLRKWCAEGVFLLNASLTVRRGQADSHKNTGWAEFTGEVVRIISREAQPSVFMLWGRNAISKRSLIDETRHLVLTSAHPSPLSAYRGFFGNGHFRKCNEFLKEHGRGEIDWSLA